MHKLIKLRQRYIFTKANKPRLRYVAGFSAVAIILLAGIAITPSEPLTLNWGGLAPTQVASVEPAAGDEESSAAAQDMLQSRMSQGIRMASEAIKKPKLPLRTSLEIGRGDTVALPGGWTTGFLTSSGRQSLILPAITLGLFQMTLIMRLVRAEMLEVLRTDYIKFARARGLSNRTVNFGHALKNTLVPVITITGLQLGAIIAFAIITETVFQWPGVGALFINSVRAVDVPVMAAYLVLIALIFVIINLIVDLLYYVVDPRLRVERGAARH